MSENPEMFAEKLKGDPLLSVAEVLVSDVVVSDLIVECSTLFRISCSFFSVWTLFCFSLFFASRPGLLILSSVDQERPLEVYR